MTPIAPWPDHQADRGRQGVCADRRRGYTDRNGDRADFERRNVPFIGPFTGAEFLRAPELITSSIFARAMRRGRGLGPTPDRRSAFQPHRDLLPGRFLRPRRSRRRQARAGRRGLELPPKAPSSATPGGRLRPANDQARRAGSRRHGRDLRPCAEFIKLAHKGGFNPTFVNISFVGADALAKELGPEGQGVIVSQVVPFPWDRR